MLFTVLIAVAGLILFALSSSGIYNEYGTQESIHVLEVYSRMYEAGGETTQEAAEALSEKLGVRVTFISEEGMVISDSEIASLAGQYHGDRPEFVDAQKNGTGYDMRKSDSAGHNTIYYCTKVGDVYLRLGLDELASGGLFMKILPTLLWLVAMETLLCMLCAYLSTSFILKPIKDCVKKAALNEKIETKYPELEPIADSILQTGAKLLGTDVGALQVDPAFCGGEEADPPLSFVTRVIGALQVFDLIFMVMDKSNPALIKTQSLVYLFYEYSFRQKNQGYGSAIVVLLLVVIMIVTVFQMIGQKKWVYYN